jgi:uncharacterized membrane protein
MTISRRRGYLDWMRGAAVLIMIEAHVIDSWTRSPDRSTDAFGWSMILGGFGAPLFLLLAGVAVSLSAGSKLQRSGNRRAASNAVMRRGLEICALAFLFRIQAWILGWSDPRMLLKVDILNIMGPAIVAAAAIWGAFSTSRARLLAFCTAMLAMTLMTPIVSTAPALARLPDPLEGYLRPVPALTNFTFFPWAGFLFAGGVLGLLIGPAATPDEERKLNVQFAVAGATLTLGSYLASWLPTPYARSNFWTSSPSFFLMRVGLMTMAVAAAYAWRSRTAGQSSWSPVEQLGRTSLFIYWIHVEMVYGLISLRIHRALTLRDAWLALVAFSILMLACSTAKEALVRRWRSRRGPPRAAAYASS